MSTAPNPVTDRASDLLTSLTEIRARVKEATPSSSTLKPTLVAVSKYKPASDVQACYDAGQRDFGENYVQELVEKAAQLPADIRWHFIGTLQSNKSKILASIPNIYAIQTVTSIKAAAALNKSIPTERAVPLNILLQVNTSGEDVKSGLPPLIPSSPSSDSDLVALSKHIITQCPRLHLQGLMTIGSLTESLSASEKENRDFATLVQTRDALQDILRAEVKEEGAWGVEGRLLLSVGMSSDFEAALAAGSDVVRVGTGIFGARHLKSQS
ncbi:hypothetical protein EW146_g2993 [Bondarzewia mesenterica]|uniref:Pyridoxal phosphate homeostasis protein n=1 Tax=Bondarzewia mesenterica TaxID=1095465 RepID=A0A4V3XFL0_9AGAM|nr:hypothetical protein EW146_g2993 [Bondarzewia mesenterica]